MDDLVKKVEKIQEQSLRLELLQLETEILRLRVIHARFKEMVERARTEPVNMPAVIAGLKARIAADKEATRA